MKIFIKYLISFFFIFNLGFAKEVKVFEFSIEEFETLKIRKVRGADAKTEYTIGKTKMETF